MRGSDYIPTLESWKRGHELTTDDLLFDENGKITKVLDILHDKKIIKRFNLSDGSFFDTHNGEIIHGYNKSFDMTYRGMFQYHVKDMNMENIKDVLFGTNNICLTSPPILEYVNQSLNINPYVLGSLIGHAQKKVAALEMLSEINLEGRIPEEYLRAKFDDKCMLVAGMLDTNGVFDRNTNTNTFKGNNPLVMLDIKLLIRSMGGECFINEIKSPNFKYNCSIILNFNPFLNEDKHRNLWKPYSRYYRITITSIVELEEEEVIIPIVKGGKYMQGKQLIIKSHE